ncbi:MAG: hydantoinase/oxoprolinase family protein [Chrysiogenetes bacterium]|nr:hydantoinase/oxoprolinase family protein [Chrysiogenetes bacterium]
MLINIDNGGTFTDVCVIRGKDVFRAKTPTTPFDLSECFFEGLRKASVEVYGSENVVGLLADTEKIRYSTTQGTNALVQRKGPRLGLLLAKDADIKSLQVSDEATEMLAALVGERVARIDLSLRDEALEVRILDAVNELTLSGANRLVMSFGAMEFEAKVEKLIRKRFPEHLLGTVPVLAASGLSPDPDFARRTWSALFNAFLHPSMEKFLYYAENRLRSQKFLSPLLIYRNDGDAGRVAKTTALKTYSSGPRGGMDGALALARHYGYAEVLTMDVGGTTTDIGLVSSDEIRKLEYGQIEGAPIAFPLSDLVSVGVGGGSIIRAEKGSVAVGPESVGATPGPACFGLGGTQATITDFALLAGIIDPATYFGGAMSLDSKRSKAALDVHIAGPLGLDENQALLAMEKAWVEKVAKALQKFTKISNKTVLGAFGGAGPLAVCSVAEAAGISKVVVPKMAAVFCALGIGFSDVGHTYEVLVPQKVSEEDFERLLKDLENRAARDMLTEGYSLADCTAERWVFLSRDGRSEKLPIRDLPSAVASIHAADSAVLGMRVFKVIEHASFEGANGAASAPAVADGTRKILDPSGNRAEVPLYPVQKQAPGAKADGPAILEDPYFTLRVLPGWRFEFTAGSDIVLSRNAS